MTASRRRCGAFLVAVTSLCLPGRGGATPAAPRADETPEIRIIDQPFSVTDESSGPIVIGAIDGAASTDTVVVTAYPRTVSRTSFLAVADGEAPLQTKVDAVRFRYGGLRGRDGGLLIPLTYGLTTTRTDALDIGRAGVYPVSVELRREGQVLARTLTFLFRPDDEPRVRATVIVGESTPPSHLPDGSVAVGPVARLAVQNLNTMITGAGGALVADVTPELLSALAASTDPVDVQAFAGLRSAIGGASLPASPYTRIDPARLRAEGLGDELARQIRLGETAVLAALPGVAVQRGVWMARTRIDPGGIAALANLGVRTVVFSGGGRPEVDTPVGLMSDVDAGAGLSIKGVIAVDRNETRLRDADHPVTGAIRVAADMMMVRQDLLAAGHSADTVHLVLDAVTGSESPIVPAAALTLASALRGSGVVSIVGEVAVEDTDVADGSLIASSAPTDDYEDRNMGAIMYTLVTRREALSSMLPPEDGRLDRWEATLGIVPSLDDPVTINSYVDEMQRDMNTLAEAVSISVGTTVTLGDRSGRIPLRLRNTLDTPLSVRVRVVSAKLVLADGPRVFVIPPASAIDVSVDVRARSNGSFPVRITLLTPNGQVVVEPTTTITARVSALAGLGQLVSVSIALVLLAWWLANWRRSKRRSAALADAGGDRAPE